jgi:hypothetical protein
MTRLFALIIAMAVALTIGPSANAAADDFRLGTASSRFYLNIPVQTDTSVGTVYTLRGIRRKLGGNNYLSPVTGTLFPQPGTLGNFRIDLVEASAEGGLNVFWNITLKLIVGPFVGSSLYSGQATTQTVPRDAMPSPTAMIQSSWLIA